MWSLAKDKGLFGIMVMQNVYGQYEADEDEAVKIVAFAFYQGDAGAFPKEWNPPVMLEVDADENIERFVEIDRPTTSRIHGVKDTMLYLAYSSLR